MRCLFGISARAIVKEHSDNAENAHSRPYALKEAEKWSFKSKIWKPKISSFVIKYPEFLWDLTYFNKAKFTGTFRSCSKHWIKKQNGRFVAMVTKDLQTLNLKFEEVMFNSLVLTWERNFEITFGIFSVSVFQISVLESYLEIYMFWN